MLCNICFSPVAEWSSPAMQYCRCNCTPQRHPPPASQVRSGVTLLGLRPAHLFTLTVIIIVSLLLFLCLLAAASLALANWGGAMLWLQLLAILLDAGPYSSMLGRFVKKACFCTLSCPMLVCSGIFAASSACPGWKWDSLARRIFARELCNRVMEIEEWRTLTHQWAMW